MLVTFTTSAYSDITMFGSAAVSLLKLMGLSGNVPGAILADDIPKALSTLREGLARQAAEELSGGAIYEDQQDESAAFDDEEPAPVSLHSRAGPLIELLEAAAADGANVQWDS